MSGYNPYFLNRSLGYITPRDNLDGREQAIWAERDRTLEAARDRRAAQRQAARQTTLASPSSEATT
jgi:hypothetical protein